VRVQLKPVQKCWKTQPSKQVRTWKNGELIQWTNHQTSSGFFSSIHLVAWPKCRFKHYLSTDKISNLWRTDNEERISCSLDPDVQRCIRPLHVEIRTIHGEVISEIYPPFWCLHSHWV
jgi:hypothetical protein